MLDAVREFSPEVQYYSIDEFFFEASKVDPHALQAHILKTVGVPVTIGLSRSRSLAKLASDKGKPFGCATLLEDGEIAEYVEAIEVQEITGIAARSAAKLAKHGIKTIGEFRRADSKLINLLLTKTGEALWWELNGPPITPIQTSRPMHKVIGRGGSIGKATADPVIQTAWLVRNIERLVEAMAWHGYYCNRLTVSVSYKHGVYSKQSSLPEATNASEDLLSAAKYLFDRRPAGVVTHIDLLADRLQYAGRHQRSLFTGEHRVDALKKAVNDKLGRFLPRSAETLPLGEIYSDPAHNHEICDVHGKTCF